MQVASKITVFWLDKFVRPSYFELIALLLVSMDIFLRKDNLWWEGSKNVSFNSMFYRILIFLAVYPCIGEIADLSGLSHRCWISMNSKLKSLFICLVRKKQTKSQEHLKLMEKIVYVNGIDRLPVSVVGLLVPESWCT